MRKLAALLCMLFPLAFYANATVYPQKHKIKYAAQQQKTKLKQHHFLQQMHSELEHDLLKRIATKEKKSLAIKPKIIVTKEKKSLPPKQKIVAKTNVTFIPFVPYIKNGARKIFTVVIDPGHGGKDSGAQGALGTLEKDVVLSIAKRLAKEINLHPHMRAVLTRQGDYYVPLRTRLDLARKEGADLFLAIHADAYFERNATGASVYALSQHGATTEAGRWLAQQEKYPELDNVEFKALKDRSRVLRSVLIDLAQSATIRDSLRLGNALLDALDRIGRLHYPHVEQAPLVVLKSPDIPSILVETAFITNPQEELKLKNMVYQQRVAEALMHGLHSYVEKFDPQKLQKSS